MSSDGKSDGAEDRSVADTHIPAGELEGRDAAGESDTNSFGLRDQSVDGQQRNVAAPHHVKIDGIQRGHHEDSGEQGVDLEAGVQRAGTGSGEQARGKGRQRSQRRINAMRQQSGCDRGAESDGAVGGDIRKSKNAKADEHTEREQRKNKTDRECANQQAHGR